MKIEKNILSYPVSLYSRMIRVMADRGFIEDYVFWDKFAFKYIFEDPRNDGVRTFS
jgi:ribosomal protein S8